MQSRRFFSRASMLLVGCLLAVPEKNAAACSQVMPPTGFVLSLDASQSGLAGDATSPVACELQGSSCGPGFLYEKQRRYLLVRTTVGAQEDGTRDDTFIAADATYVLKDAAGIEIARAQSSSSGVQFDRLGATVCVKTYKQAKRTGNEVQRPDLEAGEFEYCAPVTADDLTVTEAENQEHQDNLAELCGQDYEPTREPTRENSSAESGCSTGHGPAGAAGYGAFGIAFASLLVASRGRARRGACASRSTHRRG